MVFEEEELTPEKLLNAVHHLYENRQTISTQCLRAVIPIPLKDHLIDPGMPEIKFFTAVHSGEQQHSLPDGDRRFNNCPIRQFFSHFFFYCGKDLFLNALLKFPVSM